MPTLDFKGKSFVYSHHLSVPFRELVVQEKSSLPPRGQPPALDDNLIIHGDNLHALKALLPVYAGKVDCIYVDPPYNTGNEGWCYNDNVRSPLMREWLKKSANPVDKEDLERHDKWLCMMWPRMKVLHDLLADEGALFISIDDNEIHRLRSMLDETFGDDNFVATFIWEKRTTRENRRVFSVSHDFILCYAKNKELFEERRGDLPLTDIVRGRYSNPDNDPRGEWQSISLNAQAGHGTAEQFYKITLPSGRTLDPPQGRCWSVTKSRYKELVADNRIWFGPKGNNAPRLKKFLKETDRGLTPHTLWAADEVGTTDSATKELLAIFRDDCSFQNPKPVKLIQHILDIATHKGSIVLDSFAGSGTTAHAVLAANRKDGGTRKFILVETEEYADTLTAERVRRVIDGYAFEGMQREELLRVPLTWTRLKTAEAIVSKADSIASFEGSRFDRVSKSVEDGAVVVTGERKVTDKVEGLGGSFTFATLGEEMSLDKLLSDGLPTYDALARYVFFTATGRALTDTHKQTAASGGLIGETELYRVHLLYKPDKSWLASNDAAVSESVVDDLIAANVSKKKLLVFAAAKFMGQRELSRLGVEFCQLPYAIHRILGG